MIIGQGGGGQALPGFSGDTAFANTRIDWKETPEGLVFEADLPGVDKEEVKVELEEGRVLQIIPAAGERNAKVDEVKASMENGVLAVTVPKEEAKKPEVKSIEIAGS